MCEPKPGLRCAADTRSSHESAAATYHQSYPGATSVDPIASAGASGWAAKNPSITPEQEAEIASLGMTERRLEPAVHLADIRRAQARARYRQSYCDYGDASSQLKHAVIKPLAAPAVARARATLELARAELAEAESNHDTLQSALYRTMKERRELQMSVRPAPTDAPQAPAGRIPWDEAGARQLAAALRQPAMQHEYA